MNDLKDGILKADRTALGQAISLVESEHASMRAQANDLLRELLPYAGKSMRIGISGIPGVGKSTLIDVLGMHMIKAGLRVAVLAIDPSSTISGGSILGDKTRMQQLSLMPQAFVRPSANRGSLGGVSLGTGEAILICEAAGFDVVLVETVGVGQSESVVADLVDILLLMLLPGAGDDLQGIKRGIIEHADIFCINKVDGDNQTRAQKAQTDLAVAMRILRGNQKIPVHLCSALKDEGIDLILESLKAIFKNTDVTEKRKLQNEKMFHRYVEQSLWQWVKNSLPKVNENVLPREAAEELVQKLLK